MESIGGLITAVLSGSVFGAAVTGGFRYIEELKNQRMSSLTAWLLLRFEIGDALETVRDIKADGKWRIAYHREWYGTWRDLRERLITRPQKGKVVDTIAAACARLPELQNAVNDPAKSDSALSEPDNDFLVEIEHLLDCACAVLDYIPVPRDAAGKRTRTVRDDMSASPTPTKSY
jgi:hypothetical protein